MKVVYRLEALGDLQNHFSYIATDDPVAASTEENCGELIATSSTSIKNNEYPVCGHVFLTLSSKMPNACRF